MLYSLFIINGSDDPLSCYSYGSLKNQYHLNEQKHLLPQAPLNIQRLVFSCCSPFLLNDKTSLKLYNK